MFIFHPALSPFFLFTHHLMMMDAHVDRLNIWHNRRKQPPSTRRMVADAVNVPPDPVTMIPASHMAVSGIQRLQHRLESLESLPIGCHRIPRMPLAIRAIIHMLIVMLRTVHTPLIILRIHIYIRTMMVSMRQLIVHWSILESILVNLMTVKGNFNQSILISLKSNRIKCPV